MTVSSILGQKGRRVIIAKADQTLMEICELLAANKIGAVVLTDADMRIEGILSERDIVRAIAQEGHGVLASPASTQMSRQVVTATETDTVETVMGRMSQGRFRHMPVVRDGRLIGVVSIGDIVKRKIEQAEREAAEIRNYIATA
jgi:CBS domain-containing protein